MPGIAAKTASNPTGPALRWHGGKWLLAPWIIDHFPAHRIYVEPYGGAASVLLRKPRSYGEVYNEMDGDAVNLFQVLRSDRAQDLIEALRLTAFAREEFEAAYHPGEDPVERARCLVVRSFQGFGSDGFNIKRRTGFRANCNRSGTTPAQDWANYPERLAALIERFQGVVIESRDATECMTQHDGPETLHYIDPPYLPETRSTKTKNGERYHAYAHELTAEDHADLLAYIQDLKGMVVLSGYPSALYDKALPAWFCVERKALADGARERTEVLWINSAAWLARDHGLFGGSVCEADDG